MVSLGRVFNLFRGKDMNCVDVRKLSSDYLEEDLSPPQLDKFLTHISGCGRCKSFVDGLASVIGMLAKLPKAQPSSDLKSSILENTTRRKQNDDPPK